MKNICFSFLLFGVLVWSGLFNLSYGNVPESLNLEQILTKIDQRGQTLHAMSSVIIQKRWTEILQEFDEGEKGKFYFLKERGNVYLRKDISNPQENTLVIGEGKVLFYQPRIKQVQRYNLGERRNRAEFLLLGIFIVTPVALEGGILQMINHGISTGALFLIVGILYERRHTRMISDFSGLSHVMPVYATIFLIMTMSSIGMPTLNGFIGEFMILQGVFADPTYRLWAVWGALGIVLGAAYMLWFYQRVMFGQIEQEENRILPDLNLREIATFVPLIILAFWIGLYPKTFLDYLHDPVNQIVERVRPGEFSPLPAQTALRE